ncbi:uncharacterized protein LOC115887030 [Sitophilus oryzae]|uniref:Uncharacterized protein LOC115887030 n=1 Tax=Sitophilus oryzae TaxID=7048 RepID=A0A6J2YEA0_SITOR|nr:uncharacterized protein LOC115887030 [Sitophilus oryzae]
MNDSRTWYMVNAIPYVGKVTTEIDEPVPTYYVRKLSESIHGTNRNITVDNWFSSVDLFNKMLTEYNLTMIGTLRKNKREIPSSFLNGKDVGPSKFAFDNNKTLVSFVPKKGKIVLLLSTMHYSSDINNDTKKPELIMDYGIDHAYSSVLLNLANRDSAMNRRQFLHELSFQLIEPLLRVRLEIPTLNKSLKTYIRDILGVSENLEPAAQGQILAKRTRCAFCPRERDRKAKMLCGKCKLAICDTHRAIVCCKCSQ